MYSLLGYYQLGAYKKIYIDPGSNRKKLGSWSKSAAKILQEMGYSLHVKRNFNNAKDPHLFISFELSPHNCAFLSHNRIPAVLFLCEPASVLPNNYVRRYHKVFKHIYTWHDGLVDNKKYFKRFIPSMKPMIEDKVPFSRKKLCVLINSNKFSSYKGELYSARRNAITFYQKHHPTEFDLYGHGWDKCKESVYKGTAQNKTTTLNNYKFCICYENTANQPGYITEKIFDCFAARCIPIYWGAPNITAYIPENCFIDRRNFSSDEAVYKYIKSIPEETFNKYITCIKGFLATREAQLFAPYHHVPFFVATILKATK